MGRMGITHYSILNTHPLVQIDSVADQSGLILKIMNKYLPIKTYEDYNDLLNERKPDAVFICTPPALHYSIAKKIADMGIHAFVEKPFTTKYKEASELANLFTEKRLINQVGYVNRFNCVFMKLKELIDNRVIGDIIRFKSEMYSCTIANPETKSSWRSSHETGGGAVFEMASHAIDLVNFLIGKPDKVTGSAMNKIHSKSVEDLVSATFLYNKGMAGTIYINWSDTSYRKPTNKFEVFGIGGKIIADQHSLKLFLNKPNEKYNFREGWNTLYITDLFQPVPFYVRGNEFTQQIYHFVDCLQDINKPNHCTFSDGANVHEIIENLFLDYNNGRSR